MENNPLQPSAQLLCKLGSIVVHADEMTSPTAHEFDVSAMKGLFEDQEVKDWIAAMDAMGMVPKKRTQADVILHKAAMKSKTLKEAEKKKVVTGYRKNDDNI